MQARRIARELALLSISQLSDKSGRASGKLDRQTLQDLLAAAVRTLTVESQEALETASAELTRGSDRLLSSETRTLDIQSAKTMVNEAIELTRSAINRLGTALELPEFIQLTNQKEARNYALQLISQVHVNHQEIDNLLDQVMVDWQLSRLARIDQDILRIAVAEILFLGTPDRVAINEAIEIAKRYSDEDSHRFINGVMRRVVTRMKQDDRAANAIPSPTNGNDYSQTESSSA